MAAKIQFGASLGAWDSSNIVDQLCDMADVVDAATVFPYPFNLPVSRHVLRDVRQVSHDLDLTLLVHGPIWELYTASIYPEIRHLAVDMVKRAIDFAVKIEAVHITLHPGLRRWPDVWPQLETAALNAQLASFEELCNYATRSGVLVGIENMPRSKDQFGGYVDFSELERVLDALPDVGVTLDVGHVQTAGLDPGTVIHHLGERINHLHVHDNRGEHDEHLPVGDGEIAWAPLCEALVTTGYQGVLEIERSLADGGVCASLQRIKSYLPSHPIPKEKNRS